MSFYPINWLGAHFRTSQDGSWCHCSGWSPWLPNYSESYCGAHQYTQKFENYVEMLMKVQLEERLYYLHPSHKTSDVPPPRTLLIYSSYFFNFQVFPIPTYMSKVLMYVNICAYIISTLLNACLGSFLIDEMEDNHHIRGCQLLPWQFLISHCKMHEGWLSWSHSWGEGCGCNFNPTPSFAHGL